MFSEAHDLLFRWDPMYVDARDRMRALAPFALFQSYISNRDLSNVD